MRDGRVIAGRLKILTTGCGLAALGLLGLGGGCTPAAEPAPPTTVGSETHWLQPCATAADCGDGAQCLCGICSRACAEDEGCGGGRCFAAESPAGEALCGRAAPAAGLCAQPCPGGCPEAMRCADAGVCVPHRKVDLLFVIDDSGSMCEEQEALVRGFSSLLTQVSDRLGDTVDYRIAVVATDMESPSARGRFLYRPARQSAPNCTFAEPAEACPLEGPAVLSAAEIQGGCPPDAPGCTAARLAEAFRCQALIGTTGSGFEAGLEAARQALACDGPNAAQLGACCVDGQVDPDCGGPGAPEPDFNRPEALLGVVFLSDEDDCSRLPGQPPISANGECAWQPEALQPVTDYLDFFMGLKRRPESELFLAAIVGPRAYTPAGHEIRYTEAPPPGLERCLDELRSLNVTQRCAGDGDCPGPENRCVGGRCTGEGGVEACCPEGLCPGNPQPTCSAETGDAFAGSRYLALVEGFVAQGGGGAGCPPGEEGREGCLSICDDPEVRLARELSAQIHARLAP